MHFECPALFIINARKRIGREVKNVKELVKQSNPRQAPDIFYDFAIAGLWEKEKERQGGERERERETDGGLGVWGECNGEKEWKGLLLNQEVWKTGGFELSQLCTLAGLKSGLFCYFFFQKSYMLRWLYLEQITKCLSNLWPSVRGGSDLGILLEEFKWIKG